MYIGKVSELTDELYEALQHLIPQIGIHKSSPTRQDLSALLKAPGATLLIAREPDENGQIVGVLSLTVYRVPTGLRSIVEDVVVDEKMRHRGIGEALMRQRHRSRSGRWRQRRRSHIQSAARGGKSVISIHGL